MSILGAGRTLILIFTRMQEFLHKYAPIHLLPDLKPIKPGVKRHLRLISTPKFLYNKLMSQA